MVRLATARPTVRLEWPRRNRWATATVSAAWVCLVASGLPGCGATERDASTGGSLGPAIAHDRAAEAPVRGGGFPAAAFVRPIEVIEPPPRGLELYRPVPVENRLTAARAELGRRLFFDARLSRDGSLTCASCHQPELGFSDTVRFSPGVYGRTGTRTTPTLLNRAYGRAFFSDGRAATLEEAVLRPIEDPVELDLPLDRLIGRLQCEATYRESFEDAFPGEGLTRRSLGRALASYVRVLTWGDVPQEVRPEIDAGRALFHGRARCATCHAGPNLTLDEFHNTGLASGSGDLGRYAATGRPEDLGRFKTPTLRAIRHTRPYMHDGSLATLSGVVEFYNGGGGPHPGRSPDLRPLGLTPEEIRWLVAFLESL